MHWEVDLWEVDGIRREGFSVSSLIYIYLYLYRYVYTHRHTQTQTEAIYCLEQ